MTEIKHFWPTRWQAVAEDLVEDSDMDDVFAALNGFQSVKHLPPEQMVQILIAVVLDPTCATSDKKLFKPEHQSDPLFPSAAVLSAKALAILRSWTQARPMNVLGALPGEPDPTWFELTGEVGDLDKPVASTSKAKPRTSEPSTKKPPAKGRKSSDDDDEDVPLVQAAARVAACAFVWEMLCGRAASPKQKKGKTVTWSMPERNPLCSQAWNLLDVFVGGWEAEGKQPYAGRQFGFSPQLLRQLKKTASGPRTDTHHILNIALEPFANSSTSHQHECPPERMQSIAIRLLDCLVHLAMARKVDLEQLIDNLSLKMGELSPTALRTFLAAFHGQGTTFKLRFCLYYLRNYSDYASTGARNEGPAPISPRKLGQTASDPSLAKVVVSPPPAIVLERCLSTGTMDLLHAHQDAQQTIDNIIRYDAFRLALLQELVALKEHQAAWRSLVLQGSVQGALDKARRKAQPVLAGASETEKRTIQQMDQVRDWMVDAMKAAPA